MASKAQPIWEAEYSARRFSEDITEIEDRRYRGLYDKVFTMSGEAILHSL